MRTHRLWIRGLVLVVSAFVLVSPAEAARKLKVLIVDGQNNHNWKSTSPLMKSFLEKTGRFSVSVVTTPPKNSSEELWDQFRPRFSQFDLMLSNYNGNLWPKRVQRKLEEFVSQGGGVVVVHAANNAFPQWPEWNKMIGLGWRNSNYGDRITLDDGGNVERTAKGDGPRAGHGPQHSYSVVVRDRRHPVMQGMPVEWRHVKDELYHGQRGPALNMSILATAYSAPEKQGTDANEPMVWWIPYGKGRVFTTVLGHVGRNSKDLGAMQCVGFQTIVSRGCEWVVTGKVTLPIPKNFPTAAETSLATASLSKGLGEKDSLVAEGAKVQNLAGGFIFTEGPAVDKKGNIYFTDIRNNRIHKWSLDGKLTTFRENSGASNGLYFDRKGNLLACEGGRRQVVSISPDGQSTVLADAYNGKKLNSPNDLWIAPNGGVYFTDPRYGSEAGLEQGGFHVYYLSPDRNKLVRILNNLVKPNGVIGSPDGKKLYVADPGDSKTYVYRIRKDGSLTGRKLIAPEGSDGLALDERGNLYLTRNGVVVYNPEGMKIASIETPERPANVCFGGKDGKTLFITARTGFYSVRMNVRGADR
jgi:sugar lactone lactonase YvrE/type 1 glutamine amidotransferase